MFVRKILGKFQKSELGKFIPSFPLKHVITSTNLIWVSSFRKYTFQYQGPLSFADVCIFLQKISVFRQK